MRNALPLKREENIISRLNDLKHISVLNYNDNYVCINVAPGRSIRLEPSDNGEPSMTPLTFDEIRYANNNSAFKSGMLEFEEDIEDEIYEELRIDKSKVLKLEEIRDILIHPTKNGLIKIVSVDSLSDFDRVRGQFQKLKVNGYKLTLDIADIIERRTKELFNNQIRSSIQIDDPDIPEQSNKRVDELERQLEEMKSLVEALTKNNLDKPNDIKEEKTTEHSMTKSSNTVTASSNSVRNKPGRPKKTTA